MRPNAQTLRALPVASVLVDPKGIPWIHLNFPSVRELVAANRAHCTTDNEADWYSSPSWCGLANQSLEDFSSTGLAKEPLRLMQEASGKMSQPATRMAEPMMAITGGYWDTPSVIAGLPLAARTRRRAKLPPKQIKIGLAISGGLDGAKFAAIMAKLAKAIWEYQLAGGAVELTVTDFSITRNGSGVAISCRPNTANVSEMALALSTVNCRVLSAPMASAASESSGDSLRCPRDGCPFPGYIWAGGVMSSAMDAANEAIAQLRIED